VTSGGAYAQGKKHIEIRWCPAHKWVPGNEKADEWAKLAAEKPDARGVERLPSSLAHLKREISEK
jgi:ribonuclease HI